MKKSGALPLLVEIGCEEIPARFVAGAARQFGERLRSALEAARLLDPQPQGTHEDVGASTSVYWTPRRLVAHVSGLCPVQPDRVDEITGPPVRVAFDAQGHPTRAAESFAEKNEVPINAPPGGLKADGRRMTSSAQSSPPRHSNLIGRNPWSGSGSRGRDLSGPSDGSRQSLVRGSRRVWCRSRSREFEPAMVPSATALIAGTPSP
ncbi:MAG: hypothetical protein DMG21_09455 [Acidobacteria bacterium]|nr:MAG: hypothetical protein DMG21_09455 [Acidobacteriota bacterium]